MKKAIYIIALLFAFAGHSQAILYNGKVIGIGSVSVDTDSINNALDGKLSNAPGQVLGINLADGSVTNPKIDDGSLSLAKFGDLAPNSFLGRSIGTGPIAQMNVDTAKSVLDYQADDVDYTNNGQTTVRQGLDNLFAGTVKLTGLHTMSGSYYVTGTLTAADIVLGVPQGTLGQRWQFRKSTTGTNEAFAFFYQQSASTDHSGLYLERYTLNETGTPSNSTDLIDLQFFNDNIGAGSGDPDQTVSLSGTGNATLGLSQQSGSNTVDLYSVNGIDQNNVLGAISGRTGTPVAAIMEQTAAQLASDGDPATGEIVACSNCAPLTDAGGATIDFSKGNQRYDDRAIDAATIAFSNLIVDGELQVGAFAKIRYNRASEPSYSGATMKQLPGTTTFPANTECVGVYEINDDGEIDYYFYEVTP